MSQYHDRVLAGSPLFFWPLAVTVDDGRVASHRDTSGNGRTPMIDGVGYLDTEVWWKPGSALDFVQSWTGATQLVLPDSDWMDLGSDGDLTVEMWTYPAVTDGGSILERSGSWALGDVPEGDGLSPQFVVHTGSGTATLSSTDAGVVDGYWYDGGHIVGTWDASGGVARLYYNGAEIDSVTLGGTLTEPAVGTGIEMLADGWSGDCGYVAVYDSCLSAQEVYAHYRIGVSGIVAGVLGNRMEISVWQEPVMTRHRNRPHGKPFTVGALQYVGSIPSKHGPRMSLHVQSHAGAAGQATLRDMAERDGAHWHWTMDEGNAVGLVEHRTQEWSAAAAVPGDVTGAEAHRFATGRLLPGAASAFWVREKHIDCYGITNLVNDLLDTDLTIEFVVRPENWASGSAARGLFYLWSATNVVISIGAGSTSNNSMSFTYNDRTATGSVGGISNNVPYHIVAVYEKTGGALTLYVDGEEAATASGATTITTAGTTGFVLMAATNTVQIASHTYGSISDVALYQKALTADEVASHHRSAVGSARGPLPVVPRRQPVSRVGRSRATW